MTAPFTPGSADFVRASNIEALGRLGMAPSIFNRRNDMGMHALVFDMEEAKLAKAIEAANSWIETARPIIKAYLALDQIHGELRHEEFKRRGNRRFGTAASYPELVCRDAGGEISKAVELLAKDIDGIRSDTLGDEKLNASDGADDAEWGRVEAFNDELDRQCITVDAAVKMVDAA